MDADYEIVGIRELLRILGHNLDDHQVKARADQVWANFCTVSEREGMTVTTQFCHGVIQANMATMMMLWAMGNDEPTLQDEVAAGMTTVALIVLRAWERIKMEEA